MFAGKVAVVTGGGSGIGAALVAGLRERGATVVSADLVGGDVALDVRDRSAFRGLIDDVAAEHGRIDLLFNNAGISVGGETHRMDPSYFDRVIDVNLRGVVNGTFAAYPRMVEQGHGHIVNTASVAGLAGTPMVAAYSMAKHGVVGLTLSLRPEAALHGVRVSAFCPGPVDTPILDSTPAADLPPEPPGTLSGRQYLGVLRQRPVPPAAVVGPALRGVARNRPIVIAPASAKAAWYLVRVSPRAMDRLGRTMAARVRRRIDAERDGSAAQLP